MITREEISKYERMQKDYFDNKLNDSEIREFVNLQQKVIREKNGKKNKGLL
jgi:2-polyprenyl-3-methyl-5-hydroxy-6-metoxy-1,4-benzoquinol methylase